MLSYIRVRIGTASARYGGRSTVWAAADARPGMGGGRRPGVPVKPHAYAGDERLAQVLAALRAGGRPSAASLAGEWNVSRRTAERIIRAPARDSRINPGDQTRYPERSWVAP